MKFKLDFSIYYASDRLKAIKDIDLSSLNANELETISKYILCGKDQDGTSPLDRKEIYIQTKFSTYQKNRTQSLDEMMENPAFDESLLQKNKPIYKKVKPQIDKEKAKDIPGMKDLWEQIERLQQILEENEGKRPKSDNFKPLSERELYLLKHFLIELRTQQYYLMDSVKPTFQTQKNRAEFWTNPIEYQVSYPVLPRGLMAEEDDIGFKFPRIGPSRETKIFSDEDLEALKKSGKPFIDFRNTDHLYKLITSYRDLELQVEFMPDAPIHNLLWTLDFYIEKAKLSEQQLFIIEGKKNQLQNKEIAAALLKEKGIYHQENYISTIWNKSLKLIAAAVELNYDEFLCKDYDKAWKRCNKCNKEFLRDERNFVRKAKASDGLTSRCKNCDRLLRQGRGVSNG